MGILPSGFNSVPLGQEASGVVRRVGSNVKILAVGDRVYALAPNGSLRTNSIVPASLCVKIPDSMTFEEAATMPVCFATALQSLVDVGQLEKGQVRIITSSYSNPSKSLWLTFSQSVLIHSACGGVGHAAIQICRMIGAEVCLLAR